MRQQIRTNLEAHGEHHRNRWAIFHYKEGEKPCEHDTPHTIDDLPVEVFRRERFVKEREMLGAAGILDNVVTVRVQQHEFENVNADGVDDDAQVDKH